MNSQSDEMSSFDKLDDNLSFDVVIIGAGISGINAAYRIQTEGPSDVSYAILEARDSIGGTWDLFKYPGIRSDSDMFTFGFPWNPWKHNETLAAGDKIKDYMIGSARSAGIDHHICYKHSVSEAHWHSEKRMWELQVARPGDDALVVFQARFVILGTGYYDYQTPLQTTIPGIENFKGKVIHPQFWPEDYDYTNKNVVVIGSGATAVTIVPSMADKAKRITMLQRSPGYIFPLPSNSFLTALLFTILPASMAHFLNRLLWLFKSYFTTLLCKSCPGLARKIIKYITVKQLPPDVSWDPHFKPRYNPWEQRFCACMNGDFFAAIRSGKADVVTDKIKTIAEKRIELESGEALHPDVIVTATGLKLHFGGGIKFMIDGEAFSVADRYAWRAAMLQDVPNLLFVTGYENASWTLGADVSSRLFVRILNRMRERNVTTVVPRMVVSKNMPVKPMMTLTSTYLKNAGAVFPKGGSGPWSPKSNYFSDMAGAKWGDISTDLEYL
jgi:cation diffusion facilitator CzcD-associated flavoprotein CzcO